jgi:copper(I)-binding protein
MLEQLTQPLAEGDLIPVELAFDGAEDMAVELEVHPLDGKEKVMDHSEMHHH